MRESLFVALSPRHAGVLFAFAAFGMLLRDITAGPFLPASWRRVLGAPLRLVLAVPYLVFAFHPAIPLAAVAVMLASVGYAASLLLQERLMALTPHELSGQALGLQSAGMLTMQGVGALVAGVLAQWSSPSAAMTAMAALSGVEKMVVGSAPWAAGQSTDAPTRPSHSIRLLRRPGS